MNEKYNPNYEQSFSGSDINIMFITGGLQLKSLHPNKPFKHSADIQTLTISSTTSVLPVRSLGNAKPITFTKGARTFAGSMIFTVIDMDPFQELFSVGIDASSKRDGSWHIDEMPPFDILIMAANETGKSGMQLISGVTLTNYGTTYSVDDIYTEITYTYVAEHISPFVQNAFYDDFLKITKANWTTTKTVDDLIGSSKSHFIKYDKFDGFSNGGPLRSIFHAYEAAIRAAGSGEVSTFATSWPSWMHGKFSEWYSSRQADPVMNNLNNLYEQGLGQPKSKFRNVDNPLWP